MQDCQTTRNVIQSYRVEKTAIVSVLADLCVKHRRVASDDSLGAALFFVKKPPHSTVLQGGFSQLVQSAFTSRLSK